MGVLAHRFWLCLFGVWTALSVGAGWAGAQQIVLTPQQGLSGLTAMAPRLGPGTTVVLAPGTYKGTATLNEVRGAPGRPVVITAEKGARIESWKDEGRTEYLNGSSINVGKSSYLEIRGLDMAGALRGVTLGNCSNVVLRDNHIHDVGNYGIMSYFSSEVTLENNVVERSKLEHGIYLSGDAKNPKVVGNTIRDTHINGIHVNGKISSPLLMRNVLERTGSYPTKEGGAGITLIGGVTAPVVSDNTFKAIHGQGVTVDAPNAVFSGNTFESYSWSAILALPGAQGMTVNNNRFLDPACVPLQMPGSVLASLSAAKNTYKSKVVFEDSQTGKKMTLEQWKGLGKD